MPLAFLLLISLAQAHVVGGSPWCLSNSAVHFECFYDNESTCRTYMKRLKDPFSIYTCAERPTDPSIINAVDPKATPPSTPTGTKSSTP